MKKVCGCGGGLFAVKVKSRELVVSKATGSFGWRMERSLRREHGTLTLAARRTNQASDNHDNQFSYAAPLERRSRSKPQMEENGKVVFSNYFVAWVLVLSLFWYFRTVRHQKCDGKSISCGWYLLAPMALNRMDMWWEATCTTTMTASRAGSRVTALLWITLNGSRIWCRGDLALTYEWVAVTFCFFLEVSSKNWGDSGFYVSFQWVSNELCDLPKLPAEAVRHWLFTSRVTHKKKGNWILNSRSSPSK